MVSIKKIFVILLATVSVAVGSLAAVPKSYAMENEIYAKAYNDDGGESDQYSFYKDFRISRDESLLEDGDEVEWLFYNSHTNGGSQINGPDRWLPSESSYIIITVLMSGKVELVDYNEFTFNPFDVIKLTGSQELGDNGLKLYINEELISNSIHYHEVRFYFTNDKQRPAIDGQENFVTSVEESKDIQYFIDFIKAIDDIDGDISHLIQVETDNYTPNKRVLGKHEVKIFVIDTSDNRSDFTFYVNVVDITKPVITGNSDVVQIGYKETYNIENFRKTLKVTDNYDSLTNADIELKTDGYTSNKGKLGTWNVVFEAKDKSDNSTTFTKPIKVYDNIAPVFSGTKEVIKSYTKLMTLDEILKEVSVNDEIDGNITKITVESDTFTGNGNKVGSYEIKLSAKDNAGNIGYWTITVKVIDDQGANWWITNGVTVNLTPGATLTRTQIVELLAKSGQVAANKDAVVTYDVDTYTENIGTPGLYTLGFTVKNLNGVSNSYTYGINVMDESNTDDEILDIEDDKSFIERNLTWIIASGLVVVSIGGYLFIKKRK